MQHESSAESTTPRTGLTAVVWRVVYLASIAAFALPFATVKSCSNKQVTEYTGFELIPEGGILVVVLVAAAALFLFSFVRPRTSTEGRGACEAGRALTALACLSILLWETTGLLFLFDEQKTLIGLWIANACWLAVLLLGLVHSLRLFARTLRPDDPLWDKARVTALSIGLLAIVVAVLLTFASELDSFGEGLGGFAVILFYLLPVALLAHFGIMAANRSDPRRP